MRRTQDNGRQNFDANLVLRGDEVSLFGSSSIRESPTLFHPGWWKTSQPSPNCDVQVGHRVPEIG